MKIALNLLYLIPGTVGGTETYGVSLVRALAAIDPQNEYYIFLNREAQFLDLPLPGNFHVVACKVYGKSRVLRYAWEQLVLPFQLRAFRIDIVHSLGYVGPLMSPCPTIVTIHDANFIAVKSDMSAMKRIALHFFSTQSGLRSNRVITVSEFSKAEILRALALNSNKISVTHHGPREWARGITTPSWDDLRKYYCIREPYLVAFGGSASHKNISGLIEVYASQKEQLPHQLVILGHIPPNVDIEEFVRERHLAGQLITTGYIPEDHILPILGHAKLFVLPSLYEGFGLPVLEAQQAGVPVLCSSAASLPEVGGEGALYFDPQSRDDFAAAYRRALTDTDLRSRLVTAGYENLRRFSWRKTAEQTLAIYREVHSEAHHPIRRAAGAYSGQSN